MRRVGIITALSVALMAVSASVALAYNVTIDPANAPSGTHLQTGTIGCTDGTDLSVTCNRYELGGVGHTNAVVSLTADYSAIVDCRNHGGNVVESHETSFSDDSEETVPSGRNGRLRVPQQSVGPDLDLAEPCPNPNWTPEFRDLQLDSYTYTLTFDGFTGAYITITGP
jgi:hypothetical protein